jgi:uncharacterized membrane protein YccC
MTDAPDESSRARWLTTLANSAGIVGPSLLFGLRLWASVSLALYVESAAVAGQPHLGASLRKAWFQMIGTLVGAVVIVVLTALFPKTVSAFSSAWRRLFCDDVGGGPSIPRLVDEL